MKHDAAEGKVIPLVLLLCIQFDFMVVLNHQPITGVSGGPVLGDKVTIGTEWQSTSFKSQARQRKVEDVREGL